MKIIIIGAGTVGFEIAKQLISEDKDVVIIEKDPVRAKNAANNLDCIVVTGEGNNLETLEDAGVKEADIFISVTDSDELNMVACALVDTEFNVKYRIARVRNLNYSRAMFMNRPFLGADYVVTPEVEAAKQIISTVEHGATSDILRFEGTDIQVRNILVDSSSIFKNRKLFEIRDLVPGEFLISSIMRDEQIIIPSGGTTIKENDRIYLVASKENLETIFSRIGRPKKPIRDVVIIGGGRIGSYVARYLLQMGKRTTIVDKDYDTCKSLSVRFPDALVLHGDISDESIIEEENLHDYDLMITTTDNQELNMLTAIYAKSLGIRRNIALVSKTNYLSIASRIDIDATVSPKTSTVDAILKFIRRGNIRTVYSIFEGKAEVIEFNIPENSSLAGKLIRDIAVPGNAIFVAISREGRNIIPDGNSSIEKGDNVIVITRKEFIPKVERLFES